MADDFRIVSLEVKTLAKPTVNNLLVAREIVQSNPEVRALFISAREEQWTSERLGDAFMQHLTVIDDPSERWEVALFLADEFFQIGDKPLLIQRSTGLAIRALTEDDLWQPPPVLREDGRMVERPLMVNPILVRDLIHFVVEQERENAIVEALRGKIVQTQFQREEGDPRLDILTREGRKNLLASMQETGIPLPTGGASSDLLARLTGEPNSTWEHKKLNLYGKVVLNLADMKATNLHYDFLGNSKASIGQSWVRMVAMEIGKAVDRTKLSVGEALQRLHQADFLIGPGWANARLVLDTNVLVGLLPGTLGAFVLTPNTTRMTYLEVSDRIEVVGVAEAEIWLNLNQIQAFELTNSPPLMSEVVGVFH